MANPLGDKFASATCQDIIGFQDYLKRLRSIDDSIILNINTTVLTSTSTKEDLQNTNNCNNFHQKLKDAYKSRDEAIHLCLTDAEAKVAELKEAKSKNDSDINVQKELKRHQTRLRMIQKELTVEQIIQDRSLKALQERCRRGPPQETMESLEWRVKKLEHKVLGQTTGGAYLDRLINQESEQESICDQLTSVTKLYKSFLDNAGKNYLNFVESYGTAKKLLTDLGDIPDSTSSSKVELVLAYEEDLVKYMNDLKSMVEKTDHVLNIERWPDLSGLTLRLNKLEQSFGQVLDETETVDQEIFERILIYKRNLDALRNLEDGWNRRLELYENEEKKGEEDT